jgi:hypothetical protein
MQTFPKTLSQQKRDQGRQDNCHTGFPAEDSNPRRSGCSLASIRANQKSCTDGPPAATKKVKYFSCSTHELQLALAGLEPAPSSVKGCNFTGIRRKPPKPFKPYSLSVSTVGDQKVV